MREWYLDNHCRLIKEKIFSRFAAEIGCLILEIGPLGYMNGERGGYDNETHHRGTANITHIITNIASTITSFGYRFRMMTSSRIV